MKLKELLQVVEDNAVCLVVNGFTVWSGDCIENYSDREVLSVYSDSEDDGHAVIVIELEEER